MLISPAAPGEQALGGPALALQLGLLGFVVHVVHLPWLSLPLQLALLLEAVCPRESPLAAPALLAPQPSVEVP